MITQDDLLTHGYKKYEPVWNGYGKNQWLNYADLLYQKRMNHDYKRDILYYINIFWYLAKEYGETLRPDDMMAEVNYKKNGDDRFFDLVIHNRDLTVTELEDFFLRAYNVYECQPYEII